jgi:hypothetical protein
LQLSHLRPLGATAAIAVATTMITTSPAAHAEPIGEKTIKSECKSAGGTYKTKMNTVGTRVSQCTYKDIDGDTWTDVYGNGEYVGTDPGKPRL